MIYARRSNHKATSFWPTLNEQGGYFFCAQCVHKYILPPTKKLLYRLCTQVILLFFTIFIATPATKIGVLGI